MQKEFEMFVLGELSFFLGLQITQTNKGIFIAQTKHIKEMLKKYEMKDCKPISTPMVIGCNIRKEDESKETDQYFYKSMIGSLLYVMASRPDIMQEVGLVNIFQDSPKETHVQDVKRIFRYLKGTFYFGIWYPKREYLNLTTYTDANQVGNVDDRKRTSGGEFFLGNCLVSCLSKKQYSILLSTTEVEYIATTSCCTQILWMKKRLQDIQIEQKKPISIICNNTSAIIISKNPMMHSKKKHIPIKYHFLRELVNDKIVKLEYVPTKEQIENIFTKPLPRYEFDYLRQKMGFIPISQ